MLYPFNLPSPYDITPAKLDGSECIYCDNWTDSPSKPVGHLRGVQVFAHPDCASAHEIDETLCNASPQFGTATCYLPDGHAGKCRALVKVGGEITFDKGEIK